jgi:hypothetical protein
MTTVETVVPISMLVVPAEVWVVVTGQKVVVVSVITVTVTSSGGM